MQDKPLQWQGHALAHTLKKGQIDVWRIELAASTVRLQQYHALLDEYEKNRAAAFLDEKDRQRYMMTHGQMRQILALYLGIPAAEISIIQRPGEKPYIQHRTLLFNLSHTSGYALLAVSNTGEVGIDIEYQRDNVEIELIAKSTFSDSERCAILSVDGAERRDRFFNCWTKKEAFIKAIGKGFSYDTKSFSVTTDAATSSRVMCFHQGDYNIRDWTIRSFVPFLGTKAALAFAFELSAIHFLELRKLEIVEDDAIKKTVLL